MFSPFPYKIITGCNLNMHLYVGGRLFLYTYLYIFWILSCTHFAKTNVISRKNFGSKKSSKIAVFKIPQFNLIIFLIFCFLIEDIFISLYYKYPLSYKLFQYGSWHIKEEEFPVKNGHSWKIPYFLSQKEKSSSEKIYDPFLNWCSRNIFIGIFLH